LLKTLLLYNSVHCFETGLPIQVRISSRWTTPGAVFSQQEGDSPECLRDNGECQWNDTR
jgi:hypothetical protein